MLPIRPPTYRLFAPVVLVAAVVGDAVQVFGAFLTQFERDD